jgi:HEAT repeat protein
MADPQPAPQLTPDESARLVEFARACKAAQRAVVLYPSSHPAIATTVGRIAQLTSPEHMPAPIRLTVLPGGLHMDDHAPARPDAAIAELAVLLHSHLVGELLVHPGGDTEAWRQFLLLLGRSPETLRAEGGIARVWTTQAGRHVVLREIDYAEALRERTGGESAAMEAIIASCLHGDSFELDEETIERLMAIVGDADRLKELMETLEARAGSAGASTKAAAIIRMLRGILDTVNAKDPAKLDPVLRNMASAAGDLSPEVLLNLLSYRAGDDGPSLMKAVASRMTEPTISRFVARNVISGDTPTDRLAQVFQTLVRDDDGRQRILALAQHEVAASPLGSTEGFDEVWAGVAQKLLTSYSDESYVSDDYSRELSYARTHATEVEQISDDPPERIGAWLRTVSTSALRTLDLMLLLDLLRLEQDEARWGGLTGPVVSLMEDLLTVGDFEAAVQLVEVLGREAAPDSAAGISPAGSGERRAHAARAIDRLVSGSLMRHVSGHLATIDDAQFDRVKRICGLIGEPLVRPLAEALSNEERARPRERLTSILLSFGNVARRTVEKLKASTNPAVRRTAIVLMREFGGSEALPDLTELLNDNEPQVQREAVRAILNIGTDTAYRVLEQALSSGTAQTRDAIMQSLSVIRDERSTPLLAYILRHINHRGQLSVVYLQAIECLGALRDPEAIAPLTEALYKGEWWAPRRTRTIRQAAASALARIATSEAIAALEQAASAGPGGVRAAARSRLATVRVRPSSTSETV